MKSRYILMFFCIFVYLFLVYDTGFHGPDEPIYFAYTASVVGDGDLNVLNQAYPISYPPVVSKTYNLPDFHNHGGVVLWAPFYLYAKFIYYLANQLNLQTLINYGLDKLTKAALSLSTVVFGFFSLLISYLLSRAFFSKRVSLWSVLAIFLGTPFFYYILLETGNANIIATLFSALSIWFLSYAINMKRLHWFLYGVFFSICITVKAELWSQVLFIAPFFIILVFRKKTSWVNSIYCLGGIIPVLMLRAINAYLKFGTLHIEELFYLSSAWRYSCTYCFNGLFSRYRGIFYTSPIFYISLIGFIQIVLNKKKIQDVFLLTLALASLVKLIFVGRIFSPGGDTLSARIIFTELPVFILLFARFFQGLNKYAKSSFIIISIFCIFWNLLIISEYMTGLDWFYIAGMPKITDRISSLKYIWDVLFYVNNLKIKLILVLPLMLFILGIISYLRIKGAVLSTHFLRNTRNQKGFVPLKALSLFTVYLFITYLVITLLNVYNNKTNAEKLRKDVLYANVQTKEFSPTKMTELEEDEHLWMLFEMDRYYALRGNIKMSSYIEKSREKIFGDRESVRRHSYQPVRPYHRLAKSYNSTSRYEKAIECYRDATRIIHNDFDAFINLGYLYPTVGDYAKAIEALEKAIQLRPNSMDACVRLAEAYNMVGNYTRAIEYYQKYLQLRPNSADVYFSIGNLYQVQGNYTKALGYLNKAIQLNPNCADAYSNLGNIYNGQGDYDKAISYLQQYLRFRPGSVDTYCALADAYKNKGDRENALKQIKKLKELGKNQRAEELEKSF